MKVYYVIDEAYPLYKIGGLGDVGGSLPKALSDLGVDISLILPKHPSILLDSNWVVVSELSPTYAGQTLTVKVWKGKLPFSNVDTFLIEENIYISQHTDASDNHADKFAVFSLAFSAWIQLHAEHERPTIVHLNDWHCSLIPLIDKHIYKSEQTCYVVTIHNLMYQGITTTPILEKLALPKDACQIASLDGLDHDINILLEGLLHANSITTVSKQYAKEILTEEYGQKINEILALKKKDIVGILNGLDIESFNPATDTMIYRQYSSSDAIVGKLENKLLLQKELGLSSDSEKIMIAFIGRVDLQQKGIELIIDALRNKSLIMEGQQFIFLGTGDQKGESELHESAANISEVRIITRYDEPLARKIYAASDYLLVPSKFEPCGLIQMIANRYGSLPVVRLTGGLLDTVSEGVNGFTFKEYSSKEMVCALQNAINAGKDQVKKTQMIQNAMNKDFSWKASALEYQSLYEKIEAR